MKKPITSFEEACQAMGYDPATVLPDVSKMPEGLQGFTTASVKRAVIAEAIKEGKHPQPGQRRWFPVFNNRSAFGFSFSLTFYGLTDTLTGARLEFFTKEQSDYFAQNFMELHQAVMVAPEALSVL